MRAESKPVIVQESDSYIALDAWDVFYSCPSCGEGGISKGDSGCQNCAVEFNWEEEI